MAGGWKMMRFIGKWALKKCNTLIKAALKLIRFPNLLIIIATQYLMRYFILDPFLKINGFELQLGEVYFALLVLSTVFIAASGYIINDYFDTRTDRLNKPAEVVIDSAIPRRTAIALHTVLNIIGVGLGIFLSFHIKVPGLSLIFLLASGMLWFYSTTYKRQFLIGNLVVSLLTAAVPVLVILFEMPLLNVTYGQIMLEHQVTFNYLFYWVASFGFFAFLTTLIREIVKDAEDFEGDSAYGMNTLPIILGTRWTKGILVALILFLILSLLWMLYHFILFSGDKADFLSAAYFLFLLVIPAFIMSWRIIRAREKEDYTYSSLLLKIIMLGGILYTLVVRYIVLHQ
jgi:4-hydroxybenzoate polyprenyltransferase